MKAEEIINSQRPLLSNGNLVTINEALDGNKIGYFHYRLLFLCGLSFMSDALEVTLLSFLSNCAAAEWNLSDSEEALITAIVFMGIIIGSLFWGILADRFGRRIAFIFASIIISLCGLLTFFASSYYWLLLFRFFVGFGIGGANVPFDLLAEFLPTKNRGRILILIEIFWTLGSLFVSGLAWSLLSSNGWRLLSLLCALPVSIASLFSIYLLPESPRWLISKNRVTEAENIIKESYLLNGESLPDNLTLKAGSTVTAKVNLRTDYFQMFSDKRVKYIVVPLWTIWFIFGFTYYGFVLFVSILYSDSNKGNSCEFDYANIFINSSAEIIGVLLAIMLVENWGRVSLQVYFYFFSGLFVFCIAAPVTEGFIIAFGYLGRLSIMVATTTTWVATSEVFPTEYRTFAHAIGICLSKIGAFISPFVVDSSQIPLYIVALLLGTLNFIAAICAYFLPETAGSSLECH